MGLTRRSVLAAGAAAAATAAVPQLFAQQSGKTGAGKFYERGPVRIYYEEAGSGFPLLLLPGGGLNSTIGFFTGNSPFNAIEEFKGQYRCITADLRNIRAQAIAEAQQRRRPITRPLVAKGIRYGTITASPNGSVDASGRPYRSTPGPTADQTPVKNPAARAPARTPRSIRA